VDVLRRVVSNGSSVAEALRPAEGGINILHNAPDLTVLHVVWAPGMTLFPHDHLMWAAIGIYTGGEDNTFYRRAGADRRELEESGGKELREGDAIVLGDDVIHSVTNPLRAFTGAIHVYGGDFVNQPRSQWGPGPRVERPYEMDLARNQFAEANARWRAEQAES
jgi:predicted metal-dependent enzyme (double-stranded beta helix superfamily)